MLTGRSSPLLTYSVFVGGNRCVCAVLDNNLIVQFLVYTLFQLLMAEFLSFLGTTVKCGL